MNDLIIHISDLHISDQSHIFGKPDKSTYLKVEAGSHNVSFISQFIDYIKRDPHARNILLITGDVTNIGEKVEFEEAIKLINQIMVELQILSNDVLLIPGDHDVNRRSIMNLYDTTNEPSKDQIEDIKLKNFSMFYQQIKGVEFDSTKIIFDKIELEKLVLAALNSNFKVDQKGGHGFLPIEKFENELKSLRDSFPEKDLILCLHHNLEGEHEDTHFGQWDKGNKKELIAVFDRYNIKCVLNGNEHTPNSKLISGTDIVISDAGSFASKKISEDGVDASFKTYEIKEEDGDLFFQNSTYGLRKVNSVRESSFGNWVKYPLEDIKPSEIQKFILRKAPIESLQDVIELPISTNEVITSSTKVEPKIDVIVYKNELIENKLYKLIKDKKLFHQGHFHWSETSRAHNWIDIARLLEDRDDLYFLNNAIIDVIEKMNLIADVDLIISLGYEGNIISSKASIKYETPYTFLPYSYRWKDHNEFENKLNFENENKAFKKVLLITDVVNNGRTIRKLIGTESREKKFFENVEKIYVVSLFYTGEKEINIDILNFDNLPKDQRDGDEVVNNIEFYTIKSLRIEKCPYGDNYKEDCFILKDNLHCVHKFYTE